MRAVVMAGGEGTRLRPMTANQPKPLLPVVNRPIMEHVLRLLRRHGITDTVVTVHFLASLVRQYFADGADLAMSLRYVTEEVPLGTAGSVKNAERALHGEPFVVVSGDALTDVDLTALMKFHQDRGALVTVALKRVPDPLDFGVVVCDDSGRVERFLEKPSWGQVFSDTVNTGIYVMEPDVLDLVPRGQPVDWAVDVFPRLLEQGAPVFGWLMEGYWQDVGTQESYLRAQADVLHRQVEVDIDGFEVSPGVWLGEGAEVDADAVLTGPLYIGRNAAVEGGVHLRELTVLGDNAVVKRDAFLHRAVVHGNCFVGPQARLRGCVLGANTAVLRGVNIEEGVIVGDGCLIEEDAYLNAGVKIYPSKTVEAGAHITDSVIWESRGSRTVFGRHGIRGLVNVEITPEYVVRLASAYAATLPKGSVVTTARDASRVARALKRAVMGALTANAIDVRDLEVSPLPVARCLTATTSAAGGLMLRTTPGDQESLDIILFDEGGYDIPPATQRRIERILSRQDFRRAAAREVGELSFPPRTVDTYTERLFARLDIAGIAAADLKVVIDTAGGAASYVLPSLLGRLGVEALVVHLGADERNTTETTAERAGHLARLGELVSSARADLGVRFDQVGERLCIVDERGRVLGDDRAQLVLLDLVAGDRGAGRVALPVTTPSAAEQIARSHGVDIGWTPTGSCVLPPGAAGLIYGGDGAGGFVVPEVGPTVDAMAAFVRLLGLLGASRQPLSVLDARIPATAVLRRSVAVPWTAKGAAMRAVATAAAGHPMDTTDGVRVSLPGDSWVLVLPDPARALARVWAEGGDQAASAALLGSWCRIVEEAGR